MLSNLRGKKYTIFYKSGAKVHVKVKTMVVKWDKSTSQVTDINVEGILIRDQWMQIGLHNIESIWRGWR